MRLTYEELKNHSGAVLTIKDVASVLGVDTKTVSRAINEKRIQTFPLGGRKKLILKQPFLDLLESGAGVVESLA